MIGRLADSLAKPIGKMVEHNDMQWLGINRSQRMARRYNRMRYASFAAARRAAFERHFDELIEENGAVRGPVNVIEDGLALDTSMSLPHLDRLLEDTDRVIKQNGGKKFEDVGKPYFQSILPPNALKEIPSILDFATSSEVLTTLSRYFGFVPRLSGAQPRGVRFMESTTKFDPDADGPPRESQLWHMDYHDKPMAYIIVALRDIGPESGPLNYLPESISQQAAKALKYGEKGSAYRVTDERMFQAIDPSLVRKFTVPRGTVLFIVSSNCFHFGSRNAVVPRYHLQLAYVSACRCDWTDIRWDHQQFPVDEKASRLRRLVLDRTYQPW